MHFDAELFPVNAAVNFDLCYLLLIFHLRRFLANVWTMFYQLLWLPKRESSDHRQIRLFEQRNCKKAFFMLTRTLTSPQRNEYVKGAVSRNSAKLGNYKMPVKLRET